MIGIGIPISHRRMPRMISPLFLTFPKRQPVDEVPCGSWVFHWFWHLRAQNQHPSDPPVPPQVCSMEWRRLPTKGSSNLASIHLVDQPPFGLPLLPDRGHPAAFVFILWP